MKDKETARDGTQEPMKKEQCQQQAEEEQCQQHARIQRELPRRTSTYRTTVLAKVVIDLVQVMQPAEKNEDSATQSGRRGDKDDEVSTQQAVSVQNIHLMVKGQCQRTTRSRRW